jgi:DhnA family fructose-bisphosphate aldolase class Ia
VRLLALAGGGEFDSGDDVDEFAEALLVEAGAGVVLGEDAFESRVVALDGDHGVVHEFADGGLLGR